MRKLLTAQFAYATAMTTDLRAEAIAALEQASERTVMTVLELLRASEIYGPEPTYEAVTQAAAWNATIGAERRRALVETSITREEAAALLGVSAQAVSAIIKRGDLAGLKIGREWRLPRWQFDPDSESGLLPGLRAVLEASPVSLVALSRWIQTETSDLGALTPRSALQHGQLSDVLRLLRAISACLADPRGAKCQGYGGVP